MRFTSILLALPFAASVFAAPLRGVSAIVESDLEVKTLGTYPTHSTDVISIVTELQTSIYAVKKIGPTSTQVEVEACLTAVVGAFDKCGKDLGIDIGLDLNIDLHIQSLSCSQGDKDIVAGILTDVIKVVHVIVGGVDKKLCKLDVIAKLLKKVDHAVHAILKVVDCLLVGVLALVTGLCLPLGIKLDNLLGCTLGGLLGSWC